MDRSARRHSHMPRLEQEPFAPVDAHLCVVNRIGKNGPGERNLTGGERPFTPDRTGLRDRSECLGVQSSRSPAASIVAEKVVEPPPDTVSVTSTLSPDFHSDDGPITMT